MVDFGPELAKRLAALKAQQDEQDKAEALDKQNKQKGKLSAEIPASSKEETGSQVIESGDVTPSGEGVWRKDRNDVNNQPPAGYKGDKKPAGTVQ